MRRMVNGIVCEIVEEEGRFFAKCPGIGRNWVSTGAKHKEVSPDVVNWAAEHILEGECPCGETHGQPIKKQEKVFEAAPAGSVLEKIRNMLA